VKTPIKHLILDFGGVLSRPQDPACVLDLAAALGLEGDIARFQKSYFAHRGPYDSGAIGAAEYWEAVCADLGVPPLDGRLARVLERDLDSWFRYRRAMLEALPGLRSRLRSVAMLSNIHRDGVERLRSTPEVTRLFDHLTLSCELGLMKPDRAIYESCVAALGAEPGECLFVDDSAENVAGARTAGLRSFRFIEEEQFFEELEIFYKLER